ncbi:hypothetical protein [Maritalea mediterranea]|uniref:Carboxypeptidase regulatory-like domain-containing protein n=1 Tax=Maritalea mediterranea TaxID=2909667 RepID=A0ABS9E764_9HYPH|nr:hypothetical protein [Maritalea mediterranea]MCF4098719.1 hypothetical protein [Maritalea mediterranea]
MVITNRPSRLLAAFIALSLSLGGIAAYAQESAPVPPPRPPEQGGNPENAPATSVDPEEATPAITRTPPTPGKPQPVTIAAKVAEDGDIIPQGIIWRIFSTTPNEQGELELLDKTDETPAVFSLSPGQYVVHAAYGLAQASDTVTVEPGPNQLDIILDVGGLKLNAAISGDIDIPDRFVRFNVHTRDAEGQSVLVARAVQPDQTLHLNSGTYSVTSYFGNVNATAKADLQVSPGQLTEATLYHKAAQVTFKLVSEPGGEAIADTSWIVKSLAGETVYEEATAFPATVLAQGEYILLAKLGDRVFNREFEVLPGLPREIEIITE